MSNTQTLSIVARHRGYVEKKLEHVFKRAKRNSLAVPTVEMSDSALLVWFASSTPDNVLDDGIEYIVKGTIKKHEEYKGLKQTVLTRCKLTQITN